MLPTLLPMLNQFPFPPHILYLLVWAVTGSPVTDMEGNEGGGSRSSKDRVPWCQNSLRRVLSWKGISTEKDFFSQVGRGLSSIRKQGVLWNWGVESLQPHLCPHPKSQGPTVSPTCAPVLALETGGASIQSALPPHNPHSTALRS